MYYAPPSMRNELMHMDMGLLTILLEGVLHSGLEGGSRLTPVPVQHLRKNMVSRCHRRHTFVNQQTP
jgi:hypothetical protein